MTTCKRYFRNCNDFGICVNIGKKGYVLAEDPIERTTIFQYGIYGVGKFARIFDPNYITFEGGKFYDVREYEKDNVVFEAQDDFFLIGFLLFLQPLYHTYQTLFFSCNLKTLQYRTPHQEFF